MQMLPSFIASSNTSIWHCFTSFYTTSSVNCILKLCFPICSNSFIFGDFAWERASKDRRFISQGSVINDLPANADGLYQYKYVIRVGSTVLLEYENYGMLNVEETGQGPAGAVLRAGGGRGRAIPLHMPRPLFCQIWRSVWRESRDIRWGNSDHTRWHFQHYARVPTKWHFYENAYIAKQYMRTGSTIDGRWPILDVGSSYRDEYESGNITTKSLKWWLHAHKYVISLEVFSKSFVCITLSSSVWYDK